jgi:cytidylate kinase
MLSFNEYLEEGVNDPAIFKAVFLAGGPGSGKSFIVGKTALTGLGFKLINSDNAFEIALKKAGMTLDPETIFSPKGQQIRKGASELTGKKLDLAIQGRLGLVIDGTGKDFNKIAQQVENLKALGYEVAMVFVNTDLETAQARNAKRERILPDDAVTQMWKDVQKNIGKFQNLFKNKFYVIDNSDGSNFDGATMSIFKKMKAWVSNAPGSNIAKTWIDKQRNG